MRNRNRFSIGAYRHMPGVTKPGEILHSRYRIRECIGQGGMGHIFLADDIRLEGRRCALKEVEHDKSVPAKVLKETRDQFMREATVLARLDHPNLPKVSDFFTLGDRDYLVMDYVPGDDLRAIMRHEKNKGRFISEDDALHWTNQLCSALGYLHQQDPPLVHRDIKPSNLKVTPEGVLKLVDFGLVKALAPDEMTITVIQGRGTALYTPLEQYGGDGQHTDGRSDIYALGATLYHLLTNTAPQDARERFLHPDAMPPIRRINSSISPRTEKAVAWAMELHPNNRPENIQIFRNALIGTREFTTPSQRIPDWKKAFRLLRMGPQKILLWILIGLIAISIAATFAR